MTIGIPETQPFTPGLAAALAEIGMSNTPTASEDPSQQMLLDILEWDMGDWEVEASPNDPQHYEVTGDGLLQYYSRGSDNGPTRERARSAIARTILAEVAKLDRLPIKGKVGCPPISNAIQMMVRHGGYSTLIATYQRDNEQLAT